MSHLQEILLNHKKLDRAPIGLEHGTFDEVAYAMLVHFTMSMGLLANCRLSPSSFKDRLYSYWFEQMLHPFFHPLV